MRDKRWAVWFGVVSISGTALMYALSPTQMSVYVGRGLHGLASSVIGPAIAAVSLALVGRAAFSERVGRNARFASIGSGLAAGVMGAAGSFVSAEFGVLAHRRARRAGADGVAHDRPREPTGPTAAADRRTRDRQAWRG